MHTVEEEEIKKIRFGGIMPLFLFTIFDMFSTSIPVHYIHHIHKKHSSVAIRRGSYASPHRQQAQWDKPLWGAGRELNSGLTYSKPTATTLPTELHRTLTELRCTLTELRSTLTELRRILLIYAAFWLSYAAPY
jgi:hypothetical protein